MIGNFDLSLSLYNLETVQRSSGVTRTLLSPDSPRVPYCAPEVLQSLPLASFTLQDICARDIYSAAVVINELFTRQRYRALEDPSTFMSKVVMGKRPSQPKSGVGKEYNHLVASAWDQNAASRPAVSALLESFKVTRSYLTQ